MARRFLPAVALGLLCFLSGCFTWSMEFEQVSYDQLAKPVRKLTADFEVRDSYQGRPRPTQHLAERVRNVFQRSGLFSAVTEGAGSSSDAHFLLMLDRNSESWGGDGLGAVLFLWLLPFGARHEVLLTVEARRRGALKRTYSYTGKWSFMIWSPALVVLPFELLSLWKHGHPGERLLDAMILRSLNDAQKDGLLR